MSARGFVLLFVGVHVLLVAYATRVAGFEADGGPALVLLVPALGAGLTLGGLMGMSRRVRLPGPRWLPAAATVGRPSPRSDRSDGAG